METGGHFLRMPVCVLSMIIPVLAVVLFNLFFGLWLNGYCSACIGLQRCGKSCRLRWTNYLRPDIKRGRFSFEEEETIIQLHSILGNK